MRNAQANASVMLTKLYPHQLEALSKLKTGSILCGGVGSGKSLTSIAYFFSRVCGGVINGDGSFDLMELPMPKDLYIITTPKKRDSKEWEGDCAKFGLSRDRASSLSQIQVMVDSWNNIGKYKDVTNAFFIFDEQRVVGSGAWVKHFLKIAQRNEWILASATPGDNWQDYIPVFVANGFYKNRTAFLNQHAVYKTFSNYPKIDHFVECKTLENLKKQLLVLMPYRKHTVNHEHIWNVDYDEIAFQKVFKDRWNIFEDRPIKDASEYFYTMRKVVNQDSSRMQAIYELLQTHKRIIIFYNFNYELDLLRSIRGVAKAEWNGQKHEAIPETDSWVYLVQYNAGAEGWNCIATDTVVFFSLNYSYKIRTQAAGRIDRLDTAFTDLHYYTLLSDSWIDRMILKSFNQKKNFNEAPYKTYLLVA